MVNRILFALISVAFLVQGIAFLRGGYYSSKHGVYFDFGEYNPLVGIGFIAFALVVFVLCVVRKPAGSTQENGKK